MNRPHFFHIYHSPLHRNLAYLMYLMNLKVYSLKDF